MRKNEVLTVKKCNTTTTLTKSQQAKTINSLEIVPQIPLIFVKRSNCAIICVPPHHLLHCCYIEEQSYEALR